MNKFFYVITITYKGMEDKITAIFPEFEITFDAYRNIPEDHFQGIEVLVSIFQVPFEFRFVENSVLDNGVLVCERVVNETPPAE